MELDLLRSRGFYVIKKYSDRKMYDLQLSQAVSLHQIENLIKSGKKVMIIDQEDRNITEEIMIDSLGKAVRRMKGFKKLSKEQLITINKRVIKTIKELL